MNNRNRQEALKTIQTQLQEGRPRKEILEELSNIYNDKSSLVRLIAMTPDSKTKDKYQLLNYCLLCILILSLISEMYTGYLLFAEKPYQTIIASFIVLLLYIAFIYLVSKYRGYIYSQIALLGILFIILGLIRDFELGIWNIIGVSLVLIYAGLAFYLSKKMFPNYSLLGLKKDQNGDYLLE